MPYDVSTPVFEGPFDLLLHLITKDQVDIYEVSLSSIIDAFLAHLEALQHARSSDPDAPPTIDLEVVTEFLVIAAILVELKARRLLPGPDDVDIDEEFALWEERDLLLARLLACKTFKDAAAAIERLIAVAERSSPRTAGLEEHFAALTPDPMDGVTPAKLLAAYLRAVAPRPQARIDLDHVAPIRVSVSDAVVELIDELPRVGRITFRRLTAELVERLAVIVQFLAVLELYKQGLVELEQSTNFGELLIIWTGGADVDPSSIGVEEYQG